jgi:hypothetical protein
LLVEIFDLCSPPGADLISDSTTPEEEEDRVARNYLLQLSQVRILNRTSIVLLIPILSEGVLALARRCDGDPETVVHYSSGYDRMDQNGERILFTHIG